MYMKLRKKLMIIISQDGIPVHEDGSKLTWAEYKDWEISEGETNTNKMSLRFGIYETDYKYFNE
jgi:hypothetical protein